MVSPYDTYTSPLASRNASPEMLRLWSPRHKFNTWRKIWLAVAEAMHGVTRDRATPLVSPEQVEELRAVVSRGITDEEIRRGETLERELRHDVMAHVHCLGEQCPRARAIIHLGCTSEDIVSNADVLIARESLSCVAIKLASTIGAIGDFARQWRALPTLGFTHYQPAQPVTVGRRAAQWGYDLSLCMERLHAYLLVRDRHDNASLAAKGLKGATGTQASFLHLLHCYSDAIDKLEEEVFRSLFAGEGRWNGVHTLTAQTYPRVTDAFLLSDLASCASVLHKIATDIRLLSSRKELDEPFEEKQIGSSAMPYKRNPMRCERICGLTRFVMNLVGNAYDTAATQWLERTLDDSSNRRLSLPEAFLALDGALDLMHNVASGLVVHEKMVERNLMGELPFLATENILMTAVQAGGDRQDLHEKIRVHAQAAGHRVKHEGLDNDLLERLQNDPAFQPKSRGGSLDSELDWSNLMDPMRYIGRSVVQTERFIRQVVEPLRERYKDDLDTLRTSEPRV